MKMKYLNKLQDLVMDIAPMIALALLVLVVGLFIIKQLTRIVAATMERTNVSLDIRPFFLSIINVSLKVLLLFSVAGILGIETTSFVAVLAAAGFAVGMALQGSLSNFAAGVMILIFKPFIIYHARTGDQRWSNFYMPLFSFSSHTLRQFLLSSSSSCSCSRKKKQTFNSVQPLLLACLMLASGSPVTSLSMLWLV